MEYAIFAKIGLSAILGALVGLERDISKKNDTEQFGGLRTFAVMAMIGSISTVVDAYFGTQYVFTLVAFVASMSFVLVSYAYSSFKRGEIGLTSEFASIVTFAVGILVGLGHASLATALSIALALMISIKELSEKFVEKVSKEEFMHSMKFAVIAFVILPLLPDEKYSFANLLSFVGGDFKTENAIANLAFFNPHSVWFFVVVISAVGYVGYVLSKILGKNSSVMISSFVGGLVSSTAVTATMSEQSSKDEKNPHLYVLGTLIANGVMLLRVVVIIVAFNFALIRDVWIPATLMFLTFAAFIAFSHFKSKEASKDTGVSVDEKMESPFSIVPALKFGAFIVFIKFVAGIGMLYKDSIGGDYFYYVLGVISGFADVDAITQTMTTQSKEGLVLGSVAVSTILIAVMANNVVKGSLAVKAGSSEFGKIVAMAFGTSMVAGMVGMVI